MQGKPRKTGVLKTLAICAIVMVVLPFGLRTLTERFIPRPSETDLTATEKLQELLGDAPRLPASAETLLVKPLDRWTKQDVAAEPEIHGWLAAHAQAVLPWDWSERARAKDEEGYRDAWRKLGRELLSACETELGGSLKRVKSMKSELRERMDFAVGLTNRIRRLEGLAATNSFPVQVECERLERGFFWGFNRKRRVKTAADAAELQRIVREEAADWDAQRNAIDGLGKAIAAGETRIRALDALKEALSGLGKTGEPSAVTVVRAVRVLRANRRSDACGQTVESASRK